jgi:phenylpropionate dioxygenase-like ring-hydroxylating dioxygenase large terminal subunit
VHDDFPYDGFPTGWYQVAWSAELTVGSVLPLRYFATDLVAYRTENGRAVVFDAYCPHLGAHLGFGGRVCGEDLVCPFHGWQWSPEGRNVDIPYSARPNRGQRLRVWDVREANGLVLVWFDGLGRGPIWEPPSVTEYGSPDRYDPYPDCTKLWNARRLKPQVIAENSVDPAHQKYIHGAADVPDIVEFSDPDPRVGV